MHDHDVGSDVIVERQHAGELSRCVHDLAPDLVAQDADAAFGAKATESGELFACEASPQWIVRVADADHARARSDERCEVIKVERVVASERPRHRYAASGAHRVGEQEVDRVEDDRFVARRKPL